MLRCRFIIAHYFDKNRNYKEERCGKLARYKMVSGTKKLPLCEEHAKYEQKLGYKVVKI